LNLIAGLVGEAAMIFWLPAKGVDAQKLEEMARPAERSSLEAAIFLKRRT
jgi:hypothetical protein